MKLLKHLLVVGLLAGTLSSANAQSVLNNLTGAYAGGVTNLGVGTDGADRTKAVGMTIGAGLPFLFQSLQAIMSNPGATAALSGGIFSDAGGNPGSLLAAFIPINVATGTSMTPFSLMTTSPFTMMPGVTYWFVLDGPATTNSLAWNSNTVNTAPTASGGVAFVGYRFSSNGGTTWASSTIFNAMQINAAPVPEPSTWMILGAGAGLFVAANRFRRRR
jgi:hypothetical protein